MDNPNPKFPDGARVRLRDGIHPGFYGGMGLPGNEGWVRNHGKERFGYNRILIEWDTSHWSYNGAPDGWTWEEHFELAEDKMEEKIDYKALLEEFASRLTQGSVQPDAKHDELQEDDDISSIKEGNFEETLERAFEDASDSKAFVLVALHERSFEGGPGDFMVPVAYHASRDRKSSLICQMQLGDLALQFQERLVKKELDNADGER